MRANSWNLVKGDKREKDDLHLGVWFEVCDKNEKRHINFTSIESHQSTLECYKKKLTILLDRLLKPRRVE